MIWKDLFIVVICAAGCLSQVANQGPICGKNREDCIEDNECCSGWCLRLFYKCGNKPSQSDVSHTYADNVPAENASASTNQILTQSVEGHTFADPGSKKTSSGDEFENLNALETINKYCKSHGFMCQNDDECCSRSCSTSTSTCGLTGGNHDESSLNSDSSMKQLINSIFYVPDAAKSKKSQTSVFEVVQSGCKSLDTKCINHVECCSGTCLQYNSRCARNNDYYEPTSLDRASLQTLVNGLFASTARPADYNVPPQTLNVRFGEEDGSSTPPTQTEGIPVAVKPDCKVVGLKCFRDDECCTNRCHGFLHQCVT